MSQKRLMQGLGSLRIGYMAIGFAFAVGIVPASSAQDPGVLAHGRAAATGTGVEGLQTRQRLRGDTGLSIAVPIGKVRVGPELVEGEPVFVRRTVREGITIVEVSTTPFMPAFSANDGPAGANLIVRPDQPASW